ncbi:hypothetical protein K474DRAFT_1597293 [Panus rudis PR-1116 ss-1]|nr:hypothetical protein K474DRAFT_1597293 [Panus rudis PR-1116 ss-1]
MDAYRVAILGDGGVGKTALAVQFTLNCFTYDPTIEDAYRKQMVLDNKMCFVEVIDTAGQEEYKTLRDQWVREGQGFILVYSVTSRISFQRLASFRQSLLKIKGQNAAYLLVGNKSDQVSDREVTREEGAQLATLFGCNFLETSAKTGQNIERVFTTLIRQLRDASTKNHGYPIPNKGKKKERMLCIVL